MQVFYTVFQSNENLNFLLRTACCAGQMIAATIYVEQKEYAADWRLSISLEGSAAMTFGCKTGKGGRGRESDLAHLAVFIN